MTVDKLNFLFSEPNAQNLRQTRPPIPSSGSLASTVLIIDPSWERATKVTTTCNNNNPWFRMKLLKNSECINHKYVWPKIYNISLWKKITNKELHTVISSAGWWFLSQTWTCKASVLEQINSQFITWNEQEHSYTNDCDFWKIERGVGLVYDAPHLVGEHPLKFME